MMMGAVVKHYWAPKMGLKPEDVCLVGGAEWGGGGGVRGGEGCLGMAQQATAG